MRWGWSVIEVRLIFLGFIWCLIVDHCKVLAYLIQIALDDMFEEQKLIKIGDALEEKLVHEGSFLLLVLDDQHLAIK